MNNRIFYAVAFTMTIFLAAGGCVQKQKQLDSDKIVAKINNYELTASDFNDEAKAASTDMYIQEDPEKAKEMILDQVIVKKILLQEAQAQDFDKDRAFMKEIERYWEQALLKLLIKKKTAEILEKTVVTEDELKEDSDIKRKKVQEAFEEWIFELRKKSQVKIYRENLKYINIKR